jgi:cell division protein FtsI (penicillin-binding protein 3)
VAEETLAYLNVPQDRPTQPAPGPRGVSPSGLLKAVRLRSNHPGAGPPSEDDTANASLPAEGNSATLAPGATSLIDDGPLLTMPNFARLAVRRVAEECLEKGLDLSISGSGLAVEQNPPAGTRVPPGSQIWVRFAR